MSKIEHTPAPWFASAEDGEVYSTSSYTSVAMVLMNDCGSANARLIAAAPTMADYIKRCATSGDHEAAQIMEAICHGR